MSKRSTTATQEIAEQESAEVTQEQAEMIASPQADKIDEQKVSWRVRNADKVKGYQKAWRSKNPEKVKTAHANYQDKNPEKVALWHERSRRKAAILKLRGQQIGADENTRATLDEKIRAHEARIDEIAGELEALKAAE